jgi:F-type H+-transporting ATPase subunit epsilon
MAERRLRCDVITPEKVVYSGEVDMVIAPGIEGELGILPLHIPLISVLKVGELRLKIGKKQEHMAIGGGYLEVREDKVIVLADTAEPAELIDVERARRAKEGAESLLGQLSKERQLEFTRAQGDLERALNRLRIASRPRI